MEEKLKALESIYHALWYDVVKNGLEVGPYLDEKIYEFEKQYIERGQWMKPAYNHGIKALKSCN